jgi:hypothetical protein
MTTSNPPTFELSGSGRLFFLSVFEVPQGRPSSIHVPKMWEIRPTDENLGLEPITYYLGIVPPSFRQTIPSSGAPPPLIEGKIYDAGGPALEANGGSIRFTIKDGRAVELPKTQ